MQSSLDSTMELIEDFESVRLLINVYLIKKVKSLNKPVNQERFIDNVRKEYKVRGYDYPRKKILYTWKHLLDNYQFYKEKFPSDEAAKIWPYFELMDNCFDDVKQTSGKFQDSRWTFFLLESLSKHKKAVFKNGLTMTVLQAVEDDFREAKNYDINQKDIYNQWIFLRRFYRQNLRTGYYKQLTKNHAYFTALKQFFESEESNEYPAVGNSTQNLNGNELLSAIESIKDDEFKGAKRRKTKPKLVYKIKNSDLTPEDKFVIDNVNTGNSAIPFTIVMHDILLQCFKRNKSKIQKLKGCIDENMLVEAFEEFQKLGYNVTKQSISNEWNDLSCRYELIKYSEHPEKWPYYSDMHYIYNNKDSNDGNSDEDQDNQSTIGSIIIENLRKNQSLKQDDYAILTERLLNVYESNSREFLEIKDKLEERNLLREETNYLLNMLVEKLNK